MELLELILDTKKKLFHGIETVASVLCRAVLTMSVEAVVEGWVSIMERHASKQRSNGQLAIEMEVAIGANGPKVVHSDSVVRDSLRLAASNGHKLKFIRKSRDIKSWHLSKSVDKLRNVEPKNNLMAV